MKKTPLLTSILLAAFSISIYAQKTDSVSVTQQTATVATATDPAVDADGVFSINGYVDTYYFTNFNNPQSGANQGRIFDLPLIVFRWD